MQEPQSGSRGTPISSTYPQEDTGISYYTTNLGSDITPSYCAALRRAISLIPTCAVDYVVFAQNSTSLHEEVIAQLLGLMIISRSCRPGDQFVLNVSAREYTKVTTKDVTFHRTTLQEKKEEAASQGYDQSYLSSDIYPFLYDEPILEMKPGQTLNCHMFVSIGNGRDHGKFNPAPSVIFRKQDNGTWEFVLSLTGIMDGPEILEEARKYMYLDQNNYTQFLRQNLPPKPTLPIVDVEYPEDYSNYNE